MKCAYSILPISETPTLFCFKILPLRPSRMFIYIQPLPTSYLTSVKSNCLLFCTLLIATSHKSSVTWNKMLMGLAEILKHRGHTIPSVFDALPSLSMLIRLTLQTLKFRWSVGSRLSQVFVLLFTASVLQTDGLGMLTSLPGTSFKACIFFTCVSPISGRKQKFHKC